VRAQRGDSPKVLILDANQRSALAAARSLGRRGVPLVVGDQSGRTLAGSSRYSGESITYPPPDADRVAFVEAVRRESERRGVGILFPMTDLTTHALLAGRDQLGTLTVPCATHEAFQAVSDKWALYGLAASLDIRMPYTELLSSREDITSVMGRVGLPAVVKPRRSRVVVNGRVMGGSAEPVRSVVDVTRAWERCGEAKNWLLAQQYVPGKSQAVFVLYDKGRSVAFFAHRRLREKPPWGGVSVLSESVGLDPTLKSMSQRLLDHVGWHGVAMVEFKVGDDEVPYLIEVNGRFWGSLQLAVDAGVDFPWLLYRLARGEIVEGGGDYVIGARNLWLLGDLDHLYLRLREPGSWRDKSRAILRFLGLFERGTRHEVDRLEDLRPFLFELRQYLFGARQ
jgi:predicted ATP-grasp superfamily ATP-dependent carboligase